MRKDCPMRYKEGNMSNQTGCKKQQCSWWVEYPEYGECAVVSIMYEIRRLRIDKRDEK